MEGLQDIWGWQPALYLFLGGMGAGAFIAAMVVYFREGDKARSTVFASLVAAVVCLAVGLLLLLSELITPLRGMMMWQSFSNFGSWMTFGAWIVFAALVVFALEAIVVWEKTAGALAKRIKGFDGYAPKLARALGVVSCVLGFCVAVYTGILLMSAPGVPLWNTLLLPCLFTVSALDTGVALVEVIALANRKKAALSKETNRILENAVVALVVLELAVLALLLVSMAGSPVQESHEAAVAAQSAALIIGGDLALPFWALVVLVGLVCPLAAALVALVGKSDKAQGATLWGALGAMIGGCALRFIIVMAGLHADPVIDAVSQLLG